MALARIQSDIAFMSSSGNHQAEQAAILVPPKSPWLRRLAKFGATPCSRRNTWGRGRTEKRLGRYRLPCRSAQMRDGHPPPAKGSAADKMLAGCKGKPCQDARLRCSRTLGAAARLATWRRRGPALARARGGEGPNGRRSHAERSGRQSQHPTHAKLTSQVVPQPSATGRRPSASDPSTFAGERALRTLLLCHKPLQCWLTASQAERHSNGCK